MVRGSAYRGVFRRRRAAKTDYARRRKLIVSMKPRLIIRPTLSHTIAQFAEARPNGDRILASAVSSVNS